VILVIALPCATVISSIMHAHHMVVNMTGMVIKG
jgi:hypothetical protein